MGPEEPMIFFKKKPARLDQFDPITLRDMEQLTTVAYQNLLHAQRLTDELQRRGAHPNREAMREEALKRSNKASSQIAKITSTLRFIKEAPGSTKIPKSGRVRYLLDGKPYTEEQAITIAQRVAAQRGENKSFDLGGNAWSYLQSLAPYKGRLAIQWGKQLTIGPDDKIGGFGQPTTIGKDFSADRYSPAFEQEHMR